jgi:hypothetical protein
MVTQFSKLANKADNLTVGQSAKTFLASLFSPGDAVPFKTGTVKTATSVALGGTSLELTAALDVDLEEGTLLAVQTSWAAIDSYSDWFTKYVIVSEFVAAADTVLIPIEPSLVEIAAADVVRIPAWVPYFSTKTFGKSGSSNIISDNVSSGGLDMEKAVTSNDNSLSSAGPEIYGDPGLALFNEARDTAKSLFYVHLKPFQRGGHCGVIMPSQIDLNQDKDGFYQSTVNAAISGKAYLIQGLAASGL